MAKRALITGVTGQDGAYLAEFLLAERLRSPRRQAPLVLVQHRPHRSPVPGPARSGRAHAPALRRPDRFDQPDPHHPAGAAGRNLQPRGAKPRRGVVRDARIHREFRCARHAAHPRSDPHPGARRRRRASTRPRPPRCSARCRKFRRRGNHAFLPALALWRGEALRLLDHGQLSRGVWHVRLQRHPLQPRIADPRRNLRDAQDHARPGAHPARDWKTACISATSIRCATGVMRATTCARSG